MSRRKPPSGRSGATHDAVAAFHAMVSASRPPIDGADRARIFSTVFLGSDAGQRVLHEILEWCGLYRPSVTGRPGHAIDVHATMVREGERNIGLRLMAVLMQEPPRDNPETTMRTGDDGRDTGAV
ncbi:MAG: hypothetical protein ACFB6R_07420 [Alphaproteobacteria bacterium]